MLKIPTEAQKIIDTVKKAGFECFAVGGSVRDCLIDKPTKAWDFTTNAIPEEILKIFPDGFYDNEFGTVGLKIKNEKDETIDVYEITTYRSEKGYSDFRHPDSITWGKTLTEDLSRRDFTINSIATDGEIIVDPYRGQEDIEKKLIRAVGNPSDRFHEDALRMMRAIRIASELGFLIDEETRAAIQKNTTLIQKISRERIGAEFLKILSSDHPADGVLLLKNSGILKELIPELDNAFATPQKSPQRHHIYDVGIHSVEALNICPSPDNIVRLATLLHDIGKVKTFHKDETGLITFHNHEIVSTKLARTIADRLRLSNKQKDKLLTLIRWHQFSVDERQTDSAIRRFIRRVTKEYIDEMLALRIGDRLGGGATETSWRLELYKKRLIEVQKQPFTVSDLKISGYDVMEFFKIKPGPKVGEILNQLFTKSKQENWLTNALHYWTK